jgi:5-methylcytosine-specific restriction endonuclease McrA
MSKEWKKLGFGDSLPVMKGPENPRWKGGYDPYYGPNWSEQRKNVLKRDNHSCRRCGKNQKELGREPDVHHIEPLRKFKEDDEIKWSVANSKDNLVSLCKSCHIKIENMPLKPQFNT